jgi:hypothetical protein
MLQQAGFYPSQVPSRDFVRPSEVLLRTAFLLDSGCSARPGFVGCPHALSAPCLSRLSSLFHLDGIHGIFPFRGLTAF